MLRSANLLKRCNRWYAAFMILAVFIWLHFLVGMTVGRNGFIEGVSLRQKISVLQELSLQLHEQIGYFESRTSKLRSATMDKDFLEEQARVLLGYSGSHEDTVRMNDDCYAYG